MPHTDYEAFLDVLYSAPVLPRTWTDVCDSLAAAAGGMGAVLIPHEAEMRRFGLDSDAADRLEALIADCLHRVRPTTRPAARSIAVPRPSGKRAFEVSACPLGERVTGLFGRSS